MSPATPKKLKPQPRFCAGCGQAKEDLSAQYCETCAYDYDETNHQIVTMRAPRWVWRIVLCALEAIASDTDALDDETNCEIAGALPEIIEESFYQAGDLSDESISERLN